MSSIPMSYKGAKLRWQWQYLDTDGSTVLGIVARYDHADGKHIVPCFKRDGDGWKAGQASHEGRPLYGVDTLKCDGPIYVTEGEKCASALHQLGLAAVCSPGGSNAADKADWTPLDGRERVYILPDHDRPGRKYCDAVAGIVGALPHAPEIFRVELPDLPHAGDVVDWLQERVNGWDGYGPIPREPGDDLLEEFLECVEEHSFRIETNQRRHGDSGGSESIRTVCMADVKREHVVWLWPGRLPLGKLIILDGDPGVGKSTITCDMAARVSRGIGFPYGIGATPRDPAGVLLIAPEDGLGDTVRPRLEAAGADLTRCHAVVDGDLPVFPQSLDWLREFITEHEVRLAVIDPIMALMGGGVDTYKDADVRQILTPLAGIAGETGCAILIVRHLKKGMPGKAIHGGGGSIGFTAAARVVLTAAMGKDGNGCRLAVAKCNLGAFAETLTFEKESTPNGCPRIEWTGTSPETADDLVAPARHEGVAEGEAVDFLREILADGPLTAKDAKNLAGEAGITPATLRRAREKLGIKPRQSRDDAGGRVWLWEIPQSQMLNSESDAHAKYHEHL